MTSMKRKDIQELSSKEVKELRTLLKEKQESLFTAQLDHKTGKLTNKRSLSSTRDDIARIKTVLRQKEVTHGKTA
jgi:large subunit ribosomal protein L29